MVCLGSLDCLEICSIKKKGDNELTTKNYIYIIIWRCDKTNKKLVIKQIYWLKVIE